MSNEAHFPFLYVPDPAKGRPLFNADLYFGIPDLDPEIPANQVQVQVIQEDGTVVNVSQPITTGSGGVPLYNGSPVQVCVAQDVYSLKVLNKKDSQTYYFPEVNVKANASDIPSINGLLKVFPAIDDGSDNDVLSATDLEIGEFIRAEGRFESGDGGDLDWEVVAGGTGTEDGLNYINLPLLGLQIKSILPEKIKPIYAGAVGDGVSDDYTSITNMLDHTTINIDWGGAGKNYRITSPLIISLTDEIYWESSGATITLDSASSVQRAINIDAAGFDVTINGSLTLDCNQKSFSGFYFFNDTQFADFSARDLAVRNCYRADTSFISGDGLWIRGAWRNIYLERPDVRNVLMATGAGIPGSQGVAGITITSAAAGFSPQEITIVAPYVDGVYSEDVTYLNDQDGIRIFTEEDIPGTPTLFEGSFTIQGGSIRNCGGRSIKSQMEFGDIVGTKLIRDGNQIAAINRDGQHADIDFQVGGGIVTDVECKYQSSAPDGIVNFSGTRQAGKYVFGGKVVNLNASSSGAGNLPRAISVAPFEQSIMGVHIQNVDITGADTLTYFLSINGTNSNPQEVNVNIENIAATVSNAGTSAFVWRVGNNDVTVNASGRNLVRNTGSLSAAFYGETTIGNSTNVLEGNNVRVI